MKNVETYRDKRVLVIGLGMSGATAAKLLKQLGANVTVNDSQDLSQDQTAKALGASGITIISGNQDPILLDRGFDLIVKNPGIAYDVPIIAEAIKRQIPIVTEVELASEVNDAELIAVTGSNGKTTTTTMITKILNQDRPAGKAYYAGNIGVPASDTAQKTTPEDTLVLEVSSFMLCGITTFHPHIAVLTNIFSNHLDYHKTRENYVAAKMRITENQTPDDYFVVNFDNPEWQKLSRQSRAQVVPFSRLNTTQEGAYELDGRLYYRGDYIMDAADVKVPGTGNIENALAAIAVAKIEGRSNEAITHVLTTFGGVRHRTQFVLESEGRLFYNDSKATDMEATEMALQGFKQPVILLAGGLDRGYTFEKLVPYLQQNVKAVVLFGETADLLADAAKAAGVPVIKRTENAESAVPIAYELSEPGDVILLSPANASWDQYPSFEVRGDRYIQAVEKLTGKEEED
ncbi:UDP-N-acetylmuramoyl-L-alanine--D-glutamate ligase [Levilactobacillus bambusae]|uniref:UDP-N-acetylmuramoylalanine--D-glutamate ligase n=1 Tax=Levilactobacillus bambusae TaxID=2024736 RepID=A0A2V1N3H3_9LACO|nr:UDP-N-acetylmuramoyl-L-alanine--D-glutamate ligase [Levilactobacillus bambusae]PWG00636.1 UDP-N-acetylmuramoyl-L-alanine--D-glutamate ligase [Levilactobacillus bambusae]